MKPKKGSHLSWSKNEKFLTMKQILLLITAAVAVSPASIFILLADAPPLSVAFYRMFFASIILAPIFFWRYLSGRFESISRKKLLQSIASGLFLSAHFATWITSLFYTPVANSVILVTTQPVFVALLGWLFLKERLRWSGVIGILIAVLGAIVIAGGDFNLSPEYLIGDVLALIGVVMAASYITIGREVRKEVHLLSYTFLCYTFSAIGLFFIVILFKQPLYGFQPKSYLYFVLLGLIPSVLGHSLYNWALKYLKAYIVGVCILGEPIGATLLAWAVLKQEPTIYFYFGAILIGVGLIVLFSSERE